MTTAVYVLREKGDVLSLVREYARGLGLTIPDDAAIVRRQGMKPELVPRCGVFFSVTHSGEYWACAMSTVPVGLDIEKHRDRNIASVTRRFFHSDEAEYIDARRAAFFDVWTAKEAYVKLTGEGITDGFSRFAAADRNGLKQKIGKAYMKKLPLAEGYSMTLAVEGEGELIVSMAGEAAPR